MGSDAAALLRSSVPVPESARWLRLINLLESFDGAAVLLATSRTLQSVGLAEADMALLRNGLAQEEQRLRAAEEEQAHLEEQKRVAAAENGCELAQS